MTTQTWAAAVNGVFQDPSKWSGLTAPAAGDTAVLGALGGTSYTAVSKSGVLGLALGGTETVAAIQTAANATLEIVGDIDAIDLLSGDTTFEATAGTGGGLNAGTILVQDAVLAITVLGVDHLLGANANFRVSGTLDNTGLVKINGQPHLLGLLDADQQARMIIDNSLLLTGGGKVTMSNQLNNFISAGAGTASLTNVDNVISGAGFIGGGGLTIVNDAAGVIDADDSNSLTVHSSKGVTNDGTIEATNSGRLIIASSTVDDSAGGVVLSANSSRVVLQSADVVGGLVSSSGLGAVLAGDRGSVLDGRASTVTVAGNLDVGHGAALTLEGAIDNTGIILVAATTKFPVGADLIIADTGVTLTGGGKVSLSALPENGIYGLSSAATLTNVDNIINGGGNLGGGKMTLVNDAAGTIHAGGSETLKIDTGANVIVNVGQIGAAKGAQIVVASAIDNTGILEVVGATMTVNGSVTGSGRVTINGGTFDATSSFSQNVTFNGATGVLELGDSVGYTGLVMGFSHSGGTSLDLTDIAFGGTTTASFSGTASGGTLTVTDGTNTAHIQLSGDFLGSTFKVSSDGHGGTTVIDPANRGRLVTAMAMFGGASADVAPASATRLTPVAHMLSLPGVHTV